MWWVLIFITGEDYSPLIVKSLLAKQLLPQVIKARQLVFIYIYIYIYMKVLQLWWLLYVMKRFPSLNLCQKFYINMLGLFWWLSPPISQTPKTFVLKFFHSWLVLSFTQNTPHDNCKLNFECRVVHLHCNLNGVNVFVSIVKNIVYFYLLAQVFM